MIKTYHYIQFGLKNKEEDLLVQVYQLVPIKLRP